MKDVVCRKWWALMLDEERRRRRECLGDDALLYKLRGKALAGDAEADPCLNPCLAWWESAFKLNWPRSCLRTSLHTID